MDAVAYVEHGGALAGGLVRVDGDLRLRQASPLSVYGGGCYRLFPEWHVHLAILCYGLVFYSFRFEAEDM